MAWTGHNSTHRKLARAKAIEGQWLDRIAAAYAAQFLRLEGVKKEIWDIELTNGRKSDNEALHNHDWMLYSIHRMVNSMAENKVP